MLTKAEIIAVYRKRARRYDISANLYYLIGFREMAYRSQAVQALRLRPGDTVVEVGCGTGLNLALLCRSVGTTGRVIGIDLTDQMLEQARHRIERNGWSNVELVHTDAASYEFPSGTAGIISTFALTLVPEYEHVIKRGTRALRPAGRFVVLDLKQPERAPDWLVRLGVFLIKPFAVSIDLGERHPWEAMERHLTKTSVKQLYLRCAYLAVGETPERHGTD